ncbi:MAG TPA: hypothetical protein PKH50_00855 [bacterium]|jgi:flagellar basal body-associated protein FliL|nr:hypothetical protein [bacterium]
MPNPIKNAYDKMEGIKGRKLVYTIVAIFVVFILVGFLIGYLISPKLNENEVDEIVRYGESSENPSVKKVEAEGKITYVNPEFYPMDNISYSLTDNDGKDIYLLSSKDQKLEIAEGLNVKVIGRMGKLKDGKTDVLIVEEIVVKNVAD